MTYRQFESETQTDPLFELSPRERIGLVPAILLGTSTDSAVPTQSEIYLGYMDQEAFRRTRESGRVVLFSVAHQEYWEKGRLSRDGQTVKSISYDDTTRTIFVRLQDESEAQADSE